MGNVQQRRGPCRLPKSDLGGGEKSGGEGGGQRGFGTTPFKKKSTQKNHYSSREVQVGGEEGDWGI